MASIGEGGARADDKLPLYDVMLVGPSGVGKSSIFNRLKDNIFVEGTTASLGVDNFERRHRLLPSSEEVKFRLWDTGGAERYDGLTRNYYRYRDAIVLVFCVDQTMSTIQLKQYVHNAIDFSPKEALYVFVCNKIDLDGDFPSDQLECSEIDAFIAEQRHELERNGIAEPLFFKTSAKTGQGINEALMKSLVAIHERRRQKVTEKIRGVQLPDTAPNTSGKNGGNRCCRWWTS